MAGRNGRPRPGSRRGGRQAVFLAVVGLASLSLAFGLGLLVGRQWGRGHPPKAQTAEPKRALSGPRRALSDPQAEQAPQIQEKLTFYQTLTAPLAAPPPKPQSKERDEPAKGSQYTLQVGAYGGKVAAEEMERQLKDAGLEAYVVTGGGDDGRTTYRVRVGSFGTRAQAEEVAERLRSERGLVPFVTTR